ncbi:hypothetical protein H0H93_006144 [Arthromyces matolae]|nr:hypothetical protein H0H93_006144 [Arthromyces matolae]
MDLPNFCMTLDDIPRLENAFFLSSQQRTTVVRLKPESYDGLLPCPFVDPVETGRDLVYQPAQDPEAKRLPRPPPILLDYHFGMVFYDCYRDPASVTFFKEYHAHNFAYLRVAPTTNEDIPPGDEGENQGDSEKDISSYQQSQDFEEEEDEDDEGMLHAADMMMMLTMQVKGLTPTVVAEAERRQAKEDELRLRENVVDWRETVSAQIVGSPQGSSRGPERDETRIRCPE